MYSSSHKTQKAIDLIHRVQAINTTQPTQKKMVEDIKMMQIKIRPVAGDLFSVKHTEDQFIRSLWQVSKIEQIAREASTILDDIEAENFFSYLESVNEQRQFIESEQYADDMRIVTLEVFKPEESENKLAN